MLVGKAPVWEFASNLVYKASKVQRPWRFYPSIELRCFLLGLESRNSYLREFKTRFPDFSEQISPCLQSLSSDSATNSRGAHFVPWDWMCSSPASSESQTGFATPPYGLPAPRVTRPLPTVVETFKESFFIIEILFYKLLATF